MAHQLEVDSNGNASMFFVGQTPWHGLGTQLMEVPTVEQGIIAAGLDWTVETAKMYLENGMEIPDARANVRSSDGSVLGVVGTRYKPLQNKDAFSWFNPFIESGLVTLETAGSLCEGRKVWVLARITDNPDMEIVAGDSVRKYIMLSNSHDGTCAVRVGFTGIRICCANTLAMAHTSKASQLIRVRHGKNTLADLHDLRDVMNMVNREFEATAEQFRKLARKTINQADLRKYIKVVMDIKEEDKDLSTQTENKIGDIMHLFENGKGNDMIGTKGTVWAAYNAITEYLSHNACLTADKRYNSLWFGDNANKNQLALNEAMKLAA